MSLSQFRTFARSETETLLLARYNPYHCKQTFPSYRKFTDCNEFSVVKWKNCIDLYSHQTIFIVEHAASLIIPSFLYLAGIWHTFFFPLTLLML